jgi:hypothetical protein
MDTYGHPFPSEADALAEALNDAQSGIRRTNRPQPSGLNCWLSEATKPAILQHGGHRSVAQKVDSEGTLPARATGR